MATLAMTMMRYSTIAMTLMTMPAVAAALLDLVLADDGADQPDNRHQEREDEPDDRKYVGLRCRR